MSSVNRFESSFLAPLFSEQTQKGLKELSLKIALFASEVFRNFLKAALIGTLGYFSWHIIGLSLVSAGCPLFLAMLTALATAVTLCTLIIFFGIDPLIQLLIDEIKNIQAEINLPRSLYPIATATSYYGPLGGPYADQNGEPFQADS